MFQLGGKFGVGRSGQNVEDQLDSAHIGGEVRAKLARAVGTPSVPCASSSGPLCGSQGEPPPVRRPRRHRVEPAQRASLLEPPPRLCGPPELQPRQLPRPLALRLRALRSALLFRNRFGPLAIGKPPCTVCTHEQRGRIDFLIVTADRRQQQGTGIRGDLTAIKHAHHRAPVADRQTARGRG